MMEIGDRAFRIGDFSRLPTVCKFIALMPQWDFLDFLAREAAKLPSFHLRMQTEAIDLISENGRVCGVLARTPDGDIEIKAGLTLAARARHSTMRAKSVLTARDLGT